MNNSAVQRPGMNPVQPPSPTQPAPVQSAVTPAAPPPTVQTVDTSNVPGKLTLLLHLIFWGFINNISKGCSSMSVRSIIIYCYH